MRWPTLPISLGALAMIVGVMGAVTLIGWFCGERMPRQICEQHSHSTGKATKWNSYSATCYVRLRGEWVPIESWRECGP